MPLPANLQREKAATPLSFIDVNRVTRIAVLVAGGLILFLFESAIPRPLPWLKPGLSNLVTLIAFYLFGFRIAFVIMLLRVVTGAFILGTLFNPVFLFGLSGGIVATGMMGLFYFYFKKIFSILGISILGAFTHNLVQISLAAFLVIHSKQVLYLMPIMLISSLFSGFLVGIFAHYVVQKVDALNFLS